MTSPASGQERSIFAPSHPMIAAKSIVAISVALALGATSSALAAPAGSEYLPQVPKASHHSSGGGGSSSTGSTGTSSTGSTDTSPTYTPTESSSGSGESKHKQEQKTGKTKDGAEPVAVTPASQADSGGGAFLPIVLLVVVGVLVLASGLVLRRRQSRRLAYGSKAG